MSTADEHAHNTECDAQCDAAQVLRRSANRFTAIHAAVFVGINLAAFAASVHMISCAHDALDELHGWQQSAAEVYYYLLVAVGITIPICALLPSRPNGPNGPSAESRLTSTMSMIKKLGAALGAGWAVLTAPCAGLAAYHLITTGMSVPVAVVLAAAEWSAIEVAVLLTNHSRTQLQALVRMARR